MSAFLQPGVDRETAFWDVFVTALNIGIKPFYPTAALRLQAEPVPDNGIDIFFAACQQIFKQ